MIAKTKRSILNTIAEASLKAEQITQLDDEIAVTIASLEREINSLGYQKLTETRIGPPEDGLKLAWSAHKNHWRFVVVYDDGADRLLDSDHDLRCEVFTDGALERLVGVILKWLN